MLEENKGFSWIPVIDNASTMSGIVIYVKYVKSKDRSNIKVRFRTSRGIYLECPDRHLYITDDANKLDSFRPTNFDEVYDFNILEEGCSDVFNLQYVMPNYTRNTYDKKLEGLVKRPSKLKVLSDSGGFQLSTGVINFLDPISLVRWYNQNVDIGMTLDVPLTTSDMDICKMAAKVHKRNNNVMLANKHKNVELVNIFHGVSMEERRVYRDIVETDEINRAALPGLYRSSIMSMADYILETVNTGKRYKQYHALGVLSTTHIAVLVALANMGDNPPHITSDSASTYYKSVNRVYAYQLDINRPPQSIPIGWQLGAQNVNRHLDCQCPVCKSIKYTDIYSIPPLQSSTKYCLLLHNIYVTSRYTNGMQLAFENLDYKDYVNLVMQQTKDIKDISHNRRNELRLTFDFIETYANEGLKKARKKYKEYLDNHNSRTYKTKTSSIFTGEEIGLVKSHSGILSKDKKEVIRRVKSILKGLESHLDKIEGKSNEEKEVQTDPKIKTKKTKESSKRKRRTAVKNSKTKTAIRAKRTPRNTDK